MKFFNYCLIAMGCVLSHNAVSAAIVDSPDSATNILHGVIYKVQTNDTYLSEKLLTKSMIDWQSPINIGDQTAGGMISGGYVSNFTYGDSDHTSGGDLDYTPIGIWKGVLEDIGFTVCNSKNGYIFGMLATGEIQTPVGFEPNVKVNGRVATQTRLSDGNYFFVTKYPYPNGMKVSFAIEWKYPRGMATSLTYNYTVSNCDVTEPLHTFADLFTGMNSNINTRDIKTYSLTTRVDGDVEPAKGPSDWWQTARPVDIDPVDNWVLSDGGVPLDDAPDAEDYTYWNPPFTFVVYNPITTDDPQTAEVPIGIALEFENGTIIPSNMVPSCFIYNIISEDNGGETISEKELFQFRMEPVPQVVNMFAGSSDSVGYPLGIQGFSFAAESDSGTVDAPLKAAGDVNKLKAGEYFLVFRFEYTSIINGRGHSNTVPLKIRIDTSNINTGIGQISSEEVYPALYYDLQGRRVDTPSHGIYIVRQGKEVRKIIK